MGSDYPHLLGLIEQAVSSIESLNIPQHEKRRVFEGTALSIFPSRKKRLTKRRKNTRNKKDARTARQARLMGS
jgi:hypothetical protein